MQHDEEVEKLKKELKSIKTRYKNDFLGWCQECHHTMRGYQAEDWGYCPWCGAPANAINKAPKRFTDREQRARAKAKESYTRALMMEHFCKAYPCGQYNAYTPCCAACKCKASCTHACQNNPAKCGLYVHNPGRHFFHADD